jgi:hypothetical protein
METLKNSITIGMIYLIIARLLATFVLGSLLIAIILAIVSLF